MVVGLGWILELWWFVGFALFAGWLALIVWIVCFRYIGDCGCLGFGMLA